MTWLALFVFAIAVVIFVLIWDGICYLVGEPTITSRVKKHPLLGVPLVGWIFFAGFCLAMHLWT